MAEFVVGDTTLEIDEDGFIQDPDLWNEDVAAALGKTEGVDDLTEDHWKLVNYLREYYLEFGVAPMIRRLCKATGFKLGPGDIPAEPNTKVTLTADDAAALERGELNPLEAFMAGRIQVDGDVALLMQMQAAAMSDG